jgi:hypothetical protein
VRELPGAAALQPPVGLLDLPAVDEGLAEDAVLVANAVADRGDLHRGQRVEEACRQPTQTTVAQPGLDLELAQLVQAEAEAAQRLVGHPAQVGGQQGVVELAAEQVLRGQVNDGLGPALDLGAQGVEPAGHEVLPHGAAQRHVQVGARRPADVDPLPEAELFEELAGEGRDGLRPGLPGGPDGGLRRRKFGAGVRGRHEGER